MRNSFAKCELTGRNYIGGIAGYGMNVSGCNTLVNLNGSGNCVGTIAGEIDKDGSAVRQLLRPRDGGRHRRHQLCG